MFRSAKVLGAIAPILPLIFTAAVANASPADLQGMSTRDFFLKSAPTGCQPKGVKSDARGEYLYVAEMCGKRDPKTGVRVPTVSIFDIAKMQLVRTVITPVGARKGILANTEVEFTANDDYALVARAEGGPDSPVYPGHGMITAIDTRTQKIAKYIPVNGEGAKIVARRPPVAGDGGKEVVYVANYFSDDISILDVAGLSTNGSLDGKEYYVTKVKLHSAFADPKKRGYKIAPRGVAFTPDGKYAVILATETGSIIVMDSVHHRQIAELPPMPISIAGRDVNVRHIVITADGRLGYLSHMRGNAVSRINIPKLIKLAVAANGGVMPAASWNDLLVPFTNGKKLLVLEDYPKDHPNFAGKKWHLAHPNTIALDPIHNRYLYVSFRTTSNDDYNIIDLKIKGKIDIIDTQTGNLVISLVGGAQPTALEVTRDNKLLISGAFKDDKLMFYDLDKILRIYEQ